jgi:pyruvate,water dikinase
VVNVGSSMSHAAIVSRELGIPCVLGVKDATKRIKDGAEITVDGGAGTVTVH